MQVRAAVVDDADAIGSVHMRCWVETYSGLLSPGFFASHTVEDSAARWRRRLEGQVGTTKVNVALLDDELVGFAMAGPSRDEPPVRDLQLYALYLLAAAQGSGLGQSLLDATVGSAPASLWMARDNPRARAFYLRNRFVPDGTEKIETTWEDLVEIRLVR